MATFVLIHGAMHGGWAWRPVANILQANGHQVFTPTLTGQGDRKHLLSQSVCLETHIDDVTNLLFYEDLEDIILVLHSYAGVLAGPLAERCDDRIGKVILAGGFYARPGESLLDVEPAATAQRYKDLAKSEGEGWFVPASRAFLDQWGVKGDGLRKFVGDRLTNFPYKCLTDAATFNPECLQKKQRLYIEHTEPPLVSLDLSRDHAIADGFSHQIICTGHDMMLEYPELMASALQSIALQQPAQHMMLPRLC